MGLTDEAIEAHHLIPYALSENNPVIKKIAEIELFHPNQLSNGLAVYKKRPNGKSFHLGNHPAFDAYVEVRLNTVENQSQEIIRNFIQNDLIPELKTKVEQAWSDPLERSIQDFFKDKGWQ